MSVPHTTAPPHGGLPAPAGPTGGIDWALHDHAVSVVDPHGRQATRFTVAHTTAGLRELVHRLGRAGVGQVAIERPDGPVVDALLAAGLTAVVIPPSQLKQLRSRYGQAGNKDDRFDAFVLAAVLRTDRHRLRPLRPDTPATATLRATCRAHKDLLGHRVALTNQLRAHLQLAFPAAVGLFADLDSPTSRRFLARFPNQDAANWLPPTRLGAWLDAAGYCGRNSAQQLHAHLAAAPRGPVGPDGAARAHVTRILARAWLGVIWRCWQDHRPYDPAKHRALQALTNTTNPAA